MSVYWVVCVVFFFKQKTAYEIKECDWSSDVCSSDLMETGATYFFAFPLGLSLLGLWLVQGIDETSRLTLNYFRFKKGRWKFIKI